MFLFIFFEINSLGKILQLQNKDQGIEPYTVVWSYQIEFSYAKFGNPVVTKGQFIIYLLCVFVKLLNLSVL